MAVGIDVQLTQGNIDRLVSRLRAQDKTLPRQLTALIHKQARRILQKQRATLYGLPVKGKSGSSGLRAKVGAGLRLRGGTGSQARLRIVTTVPSSDLGFAPRGLDTEFSGWRAPLFGNKHHWYHHSMSGPSWFIGPAQQAQEPIRVQIVRLLNLTAEEISNSGR